VLCFWACPKDVGLAEYPGELATGWARPIVQGPAASTEISRAAELIHPSCKPLLLLGLQAEQASMADALQRLVRANGLPYCATFQGPGAWVAPEQFAGRVGLFRNQPGDHLLDAADCVITVGFDAVEFDPASGTRARRVRLWRSMPFLRIRIRPSCRRPN
jgi:acetolactate synthase-1/2/3 large subunit